MNSLSPDKSSFNIASYQFVFTPLQITVINRVPKKQTISTDSKYIVQLQKGVQIIKRLNNKIQLRRTLDFYFNNQENVRIKIFNPKSANFCLAIYKQQDWQKRYLQSLKIQFLEAFQNYTKEIKTKISDYTFILQKIEHKEQFATYWKQFKAGCTKYHQILNTKNLDGLFQLRYQIQIKSEIDFLADRQQPKIKLVSKRSHESQKRSNSSINSKSRKKQQNSISTIQKNMNRCQSQFFSTQQSKEEKINKTQFIKDFSPSSSIQNVYKQVSLGQSLNPPQVQQSQNLKAVNFIPLHSIIKKNEILSDIVEASYQGDSQMNSGGDKTGRKWKEMPQIKQEEQAIILKRKTYHFLNKQEQFPVQIRRNNSLDILKTSNSGLYIQNDEVYEEKYDQDYETNDKSYVYSASVTSNTEKRFSGNHNKVIFFLLLLLVFYALTTIKFLLKVKNPKRMVSFRRPKNRVIAKTSI